MNSIDLELMVRIFTYKDRQVFVGKEDVRNCGCGNSSIVPTDVWEQN
jgi:hypothetical protein